MVVEMDLCKTSLDSKKGFLNRCACFTIPATSASQPGRSTFSCVRNTTPQDARSGVPLLTSGNSGRRHRDDFARREKAPPAAAGTVYEQPLNERMRTFLRLDFLYQQTLYHEEREDAWSTRAAVSSLLEILAITARGDIRSEVLKELERQMSVMHDYQARPGVDGSRLRAVLSNLARLRTELNSAGALFMQRLRDSEFLNSIKHRSTIPGGTCEFDLPDYRHWLDQPFDGALGRVQRLDDRRSGRCATPSLSCCG